MIATPSTPSPGPVRHPLVRLLGACAPLTFLALALLPGSPSAVAAPQAVSQSWCEEHREWNHDQVRECEVRGFRLVATEQPLRIDGGLNGGVSVIGEDRDDIAIEAKVQSWGASATEARETLNTIDLDMPAAGEILEARGPEQRRRLGWSVSYRVLVPRQMDLDLEVHNGGVKIREVRGNLRFNALNGGVTLAGVGGDVQGRVVNGGLAVELTGSSWDGAGLNASATNGGVKIWVPEGYNAELTTGTVNGRLNIDFPIDARGSYPKRISTTLGSGGPRVKAMTTNGGVKIVRY